MKTTIILILVLMAAGCGHHDHAPHTSLSGEEEEAMYILTGYGKRYEIFAEAGLLVSNNTIPMLVHVTDLNNFSPLQEGTITLTLYHEGNSQAGAAMSSPEAVERDLAAIPAGSAPSAGTTPRKAFSESSGEPLRPGIWDFNITGPGAGSYRLDIVVSTPDVTDTVTFHDLAFHSGRQQAIDMALGQDFDHPAAVSFTREQAWLVDFGTEVAEKRQFGPTLKTVGRILTAQGDEITLSARTGGIVNFVARSMYEGTNSQAGEQLMEIQGGTLAEGNIMLQYNEALNNYQQAKTEYERLSELAADRIVSERDLGRAETSYRNARDTYEVMRENFTDKGQPVTAPFAGYIRHLHVHNGQHVDAGQPLVSIVRESDLVIRAEVQQRHAHLLGSIYGANIGNANGGMYELEELGGTVLSYARDINGNGHLLPVHLGISDRKDLVPGSVVDVYLKTRSEEEVLAVPVSALMEEQGNYFVYVQLHPESFEKRQVTRGSSDGLLVEISGGLQEGERIVTRGATMIRIAAATGNLDPHAGHTH